MKKTRKAFAVLKFEPCSSQVNLFLQPSLLRAVKARSKELQISMSELFRAGAKFMLTEDIIITGEDFSCNKQMKGGK